MLEEEQKQTPKCSIVRRLFAYQIMFKTSPAFKGTTFTLCSISIDTHIDTDTDTELSKLERMI